MKNVIIVPNSKKDNGLEVSAGRLKRSASELPVESGGSPSASSIGFGLLGEVKVCSSRSFSSLICLCFSS